MRERAFIVAVLAIGMFQIARAQNPPATAPITKLPVRRVVLYKNGVGYFEHFGRVRGNQSVAIDLNTAQLNDVLKSLTTLDLGDGQITNVSFNSDAPFAQRLHELTLPLGENTTRADLLGALRGARLEVHSGERVITGRLLSIERRPHKDEPRDELTLVTDAGEMRSIELTPAVAVKMAERDSADQVGAYLGLLASNRAQDHRRLTIATMGTAARDVLVSYVSEVPVWKTTYRLVIPTDGAPALQGWAVVDNTIGEDWENVELSLVAGSPQSFVQALSQPLYVKRPVVGVGDVNVAAPQVHQGTLTESAAPVVGRIIDSTGAVLPGVTIAITGNSNRRTAVVTDRDGVYRFINLQTGTYRLEASLAGFNRVTVDRLEVMGAGGTIPDIRLAIGTLAETITVTGASPGISLSNRRGSAGNGGGARSISGGMVSTEAPAPPPDRVLVEDRLAGMQASAEGKSLGDLFEYRVTAPVTIRKNQSALVPILKADIDLQRVSIWNERINGSRPLRSVWLTNTSGLTLDAGSFTVLEGSTFAGEGLVEPIKPGERRLLSYAVDLGVQIDLRRGDTAQRVSHVQIVRGVAVERTEQVMSRTYIIRNSDTTPRTVVVEHPVRAGWTLARGTTPVETSLGAYRFAVPVEPKGVATLIVEEHHPIDATYAISSLTDQQLTVFVRDARENPRLLQALSPIKAKKNEIASLDGQLQERQEEANGIASEQQRIRENIAVLKGGSTDQLMKRYVAQLNAHEDRIAVLKRETADLEQRRALARGELGALIEALSLDFEVADAGDGPVI